LGNQGRSMKERGIGLGERDAKSRKKEARIRGGVETPTIGIF